jgi:putative zinc finger protein
MSDIPTRLVRDALRRTAATPSPSCIDAAMLAAWADGSLRRRARAEFEAHAAGCERCQALVAAMTKTAPPSVPRSRWLTSKMGWLVPVAAAAAALVLWIAVPQPRIGRAGSPPSSGAEAPAARAALPSAPSSSSPTSRAPTAQSGAVSTDRTERLRPRRSATGATSTEAEHAPVAAPDGRETPPPPQAAPTAAPSTATKDGRSAAGAADARADAALAGATASPPDATSLPVAQGAAAAPGAAFNSALARSMMQDAAKAAPAVEIASPDANVRWRIIGSNVQHSRDAAITWQTQSTGVSAALRSGAAPSPTVCWIVGAAGTVVRSVDGRTWQRVAFPETVDLRAVRASDAAHAVVTAVDGRTFATLDGGRTWQASRR